MIDIPFDCISNSIGFGGLFAVEESLVRAMIPRFDPIRFLEKKMGDLVEDERLLVVDGIDAVGKDRLGAEALPHRVGGQAEHVHLDVSRHALVGQELARYHLSQTNEHRL